MTALKFRVGQHNLNSDVGMNFQMNRRFDRVGGLQSENAAA